MANTHENLTSLFTDTADAIREKTGGTEPIVADSFPEAVRAIETCPEDALFLRQKVEEAIMPKKDRWEYVTYGDGKFVSVTSYSDAVAHSTDGINWNATTMPSRGYWCSVAYGGGKFVAVLNASSTAAYSTDGINWTPVDMPSSEKWQSVTYGDGMFVAVASNSKAVAYSADGVTWNATISRSAYWHTVTYGDGTFVAVSNGSTDASYSADGINWNATTMPSKGNWRSVAYGNGKFVAVAAGTAAAYSTDGINWIATTLPSTETWYSVAYGDGMFVATAISTADAAYSTDGINWTATTMPIDEDWKSVTYGDGKFVAVANGSTAAAYSTDGINWHDQHIKTYIESKSGEDVTDVTEETVQATKLLDDELSTQDDLIAQIYDALESKLYVFINFTVDGVSYKAREGMTWEEWCDSDYNTGEYYIRNGVVCFPDGSNVTASGAGMLKKTSSIVAGHAYYKLDNGGN